jgi:DNA (cytosine-5)-methyltransferase 1
MDINPQPHYPFKFIQRDVLSVDPEWVRENFDAVHASPPCQHYTSIQSMNKYKKEHPDLVYPVRILLRKIGLPYIMENVPGSPMDAIRLCGSSFGLKVRRHRHFESSHVLLAPSCNHGKERAIAVYGDHPEKCPTGKINRAWTLQMGQEAMGIDWMPWRSLTQAIPPAMTEHLGRQLIEILGRTSDEQALLV